VLNQCGFISQELLETFEDEGGMLAGQPIRNRDLGIEFSSGSLGMGLSFGIGLALSARMTGSHRQVYVLLGDGESNEGSVWEAAMSGRHFKLDNLTAVVDVNDMQSDGRTSEVLRMDHAAMWDGFGWDVRTVLDGHNISQLLEAFEAPAIGAPRVVLAHTVKGKGVSFMEHNLDWHHGRLSADQLAAAIQELGQFPEVSA
jgi:transketolase